MQRSKLLSGLPIFSLSGGYLHLFLDFSRGYFHPLFIIRGYHCMFKGAKRSRDLSVTKSYFECRVRILSVMQSFYNPPPKKKKLVILMLMQVCNLLRGHNCFVTNARNSHFFRLTHSTKLQRVNTPLTSKFWGSTAGTGQTWGGWKSVLVRQRRANCALLGALI